MKWNTNKKSNSEYQENSDAINYIDRTWVLNDKKYTSGQFNKHGRHHNQSNIALMEKTKERKFILSYIGKSWVMDGLNDPNNSCHKTTEE